MSVGSAYPGLVQFYVRDENAEGVVVGWDDGYLVVMSESDGERRLQRVDPWKCRVIGHVQIESTGEEIEEAEIVTGPAKGAACA